MKRFFPKSLTAQFAWLMATVTLSVLCFTIFIMGNERGRALNEARLTGQLERLASLVHVLEGVPTEVRSELMAIIPPRHFRMSLTQSPAISGISDTQDGQLIADLLSMHWDDGVTPQIGVEIKPKSRRPARVSIQVDANTWLNVRFDHTERLGPPLYLRIAVAVPLVLSFLGVLLVGIIFLRRLNRPLKQLRDAALQVGEGDRRIRIPETGPAELRTLASAFNTMQQKLQEGEEERDRSVAAIGHDLRTPITGLRLRAEMLESKEERDAMVRLLDQMTRLADGLLAWGRSGSDTEANVPFDLAELVQDLCDDPMFNFPYEGPDHVSYAGQKHALRRAITNVLENAKRYASDATVSLSQTADEIELTVNDQGPGIPPKQLATIIKPYIRGESSRSSETGGTGLGLAIVERIIRAHNGTLKIANRPRGGIEVIITLRTA